ncbi:tape measure protein [Lysobacter gummosus]|uniref:Tape measure protein n=1 Tax=Lysobacter gummosus TaxID=262324 RepID=A0ABY3XE50_9GAMM|nr:tape measure protein [Lysobacter gummosus]ALN93802.1 tape measure domain protein [Lysobacter gummosus]UNP29241.1 tape measure protein [Lysobacter gummosus]
MANRDTTITLLLKGNAAALNAALQQAGARIRSFASESQAAGRKAQAGLSGLQSEIRGVAAGYLSLRSAQGLAHIADEATNLQGRLKLATKTQEEFNTAYSGVQQIAQATRQPLASTVDLYARIERSTQALKLGQDQLLGLTQTVSQAVALSFTSGASGEAAIMQLGQGLSVGRLGGEELNSVLEQTPRLAEAIKTGLKELGVEGADNLKKLASEGKLTTTLVLRAIQSQGKSVAEEFAKLPVTIGGAMTQLRNAFTVTVGDMERSTGAAGALSTEISSLASFISNYNAALVTAGGSADAAGQKFNVLVSIVRVAVTAFIGLKVGFQIIGRVIAALMVSIENFGRYLILNGRVIVAYVEAVKKVAQFDFSGPDQLFQVQQKAFGDAKGLVRQTAEAWRAAGGDMADDIGKANSQLELLWKTSADAKPAQDFAASAKTIADGASKVKGKAGSDKDDAKRKAEKKKEEDEQKRKDDDRRKELTEAVAAAENAILRVQGKEREGRERELTAQYAPLLADMKRLGVVGESTLRLHIDTESAQAELQELQAQVERVFGDQSRQEQSIQTRQQAGLLTEIGARRELIDLHSRTAAEVDQLLPKMDQLAAKTGSPDAIERVKDLTTQVAALKVQSNELVVTLTNGFESGLSNALEGLATGTLTLRQALTGLVQDMARSLAQLASQQLAALATAKLMSLVSKIVGGGRTPDVAQPDPVQAAAAGVAYATPITGASVALGVAGGVVLKAAAAMQSAAATLLAANAAKSASGFFASGGFTGTGPKYAPAGVVHRGEFVHRREVVRQPGARSFLARFNRIGMAALDNLRGYASGGLVTPAPRVPNPSRAPMSERGPTPSESGQRGSQITNVLYLDPREIVNVMSTQAGRQVILSTIRANAPTVRQDLG